MPRLLSAGILLHRRNTDGEREVLLGHLGGPYWSAKHEHAWSIPKGVVEDGEEPLAAAHREFSEELGCEVPPGDLIDLGIVRQSKKDVRIWALSADLDPRSIKPGTFEMEWPPRSGKLIEVPELDRVAWFGLVEAEGAIVAAQSEFLHRLQTLPD